MTDANASAPHQWYCGWQLTHKSRASATNTPRSPFPRSPKGRDGDTPSVLEEGGDLYNSCPEGMLNSKDLTLSFTAPQPKKEEAVTAITATNMHEDGENVLLGDAAGRVSVFAKHSDTQLGDELGAHDLPVCGVSSSHQWGRRLTHQAFIQEFDCQRSAHIDAKITCMQFLPQRSEHYNMYLVANERATKLFRVRDDHSSPAHSRRCAVTPSKTFAPLFLDAGSGQGMPRTHTVSLGADKETFISADDLQVWWWHLEHGHRGVCVADLRPPKGEEISELMASVQFHPTHASLFAYSSSGGVTHVVDLREPTHLIRSGARRKQGFENPPPDFQCEDEIQSILECVSDVSFGGPQGEYIVTRDFMALRVWDARNNSAPVASVNVHPQFIPHLEQLYENDQIFDKFTCSAAAHTPWIATGSYNGNVLLWNHKTNEKEIFAVEPLTFATSDAVARHVPEMRFIEGDEPQPMRISSVSINKQGTSVCAAADDALTVFCRSKNGTPTVTPTTTRKKTTPNVSPPADHLSLHSRSLST